MRRIRHTRAQNLDLMAKESIDKKFKIRLDSSTIFSGTIVACEFTGYRDRGMSKIAQFTVTLESATGLRKVVPNMEALPR